MLVSGLKDLLYLESWAVINFEEGSETIKFSIGAISPLLRMGGTQDAINCL